MKIVLSARHGGVLDTLLHPGQRQQRLRRAQSYGLAARGVVWISGNLAAIRQVTGLTEARAQLPVLLLMGASLAEGMLCGLLARPWRGPRGRLEVALKVGCGLWACFLIADEICAFYLGAATHWGLLMAHLLGLISLQWRRRGDVERA